MMRSMFTGVAGLRTHQTKMDVIGNNISNVNTVGYKASSATFKEIFAQTIQGASAANNETGRGGTNPMQIGLGVSISSIDTLMTQGAAQTTDNPLDLMINGNAFFVVGDESAGQYFTRAGSFRLDEHGKLVNPAGMNVYGWNAAPDSQNPGSMKIEKGQAQPITIKSVENLSIKPTPTSNISFEGNLNMEEGQTDKIVKSIDFYDTLGNYYKVDINLWYVPSENGSEAYWRFEPADTMTRNETETLEFDWDHSGCILKFNTDGTLKSVDDNAEGEGFINFNVMSDLGIDAELPEIKLNFSGLTQFNQITDAKGSSLDGCPAGNLTGFSVGPDGKITGSYSNGRTKTLGQIIVATFKNPMGLERVGDNLFKTTANSGGFDGIGSDPSSGGGSLGGGRLEMSNVDLSREFTDMITTQRGFQANTKVITTSDEILQELVKLK